MRKKLFGSAAIIFSLAFVDAASADMHSHGGEPAAGEMSSCSVDKKNSLSGFFVKLGVTGSYDKTRLFDMGENMYWGNTQAPLQVTEPEEMRKALEARDYGDVNLTPGDGNDMVGISATRRIPPLDFKARRWSGHFAIGYGWFVSDSLYAGLECFGDLGRRNTRKHDLTGYDSGSSDSGTVELRTSTNGLSPGAALKLGYYDADLGSMLYVKFGATNVRRRLEMDDLKDTIRLSKLVPVVAVGFAVTMTPRLSAGLECEYRYRSGLKKGTLLRSTSGTVSPTRTELGLPAGLAEQDVAFDQYSLSAALRGRGVGALRAYIAWKL